MQIEEGKFYRTAAGEKVGPMVPWFANTGLFHVQSGPCVGGLWKPDGTAEYPGAGDSPPLIAECREAQPGDRIRMLEDDFACGYNAGDHFVTADGESFRDNDGHGRPLDLHPHEVVGAAEKPLQVGDRVRALDSRPEGETGTVVAVNYDSKQVLVAFDNWRDGHNGRGAGLDLNGSGWWLRPDDLECLPPLRVEAGKHYRTQSGAVIGPMMDFGDGRFIKEFGDGCIWLADGKRHCGTLGDIVAEVAAPAQEAKPAAAAQFKVGDRVRAVANSPRGLTGTVVEVGRTNILVDYDGWRGGHTGADGQLPKESGWYMGRDEIEHVADVAPVAFKVGDRVRFTDKCPRLWWFGPHTNYEDGVIATVRDESAAGYRYHVKVGNSDRAAFVNSKHIERAPSTTSAPAFKIGDRVRRSGGLFPEEIGTVARVFGIGDFYRVEWDNGEGTSDTWTTRELVTAPAFPPPSPTRHAIVAAIENGKPKPAHRPRVHPDRATAAKEAQRLARVNPGKEFGVYELAETRSTAAPKHEWQRLAAAGRRDAAVSELMRVAGVAAPSAFSAVDRFRNAA